eukprot:gene18893-107_t
MGSEKSICFASYFLGRFHLRYVTAGAFHQCSPCKTLKNEFDRQMFTFRKLFLHLTDNTKESLLLCVLIHASVVHAFMALCSCVRKFVWRATIFVLEWATGITNSRYCLMEKQKFSHFLVRASHCNAGDQNYPLSVHKSQQMHVFTSDTKYEGSVLQSPRYVSIMILQEGLLMSWMCWIVTFGTRFTRIIFGRFVGIFEGIRPHVTGVGVTLVDILPALRHYPSTLLVCGDKDPLIKSMVKAQSALREAGTHAETLTYNSRHAFLGVPPLWRGGDNGPWKVDAAPATRQIIKFMTTHDSGDELGASLLEKDDNVQPPRKFASGSTKFERITHGTQRCSGGWWRALI